MTPAPVSGYSILFGAALVLTVMLLAGCQGNPFYYTPPDSFTDMEEKSPEYRANPDTQHIR